MLNVLYVFFYYSLYLFAIRDKLWLPEWQNDYNKNEVSVIKAPSQSHFKILRQVVVVGTR